MSDQFDLINDTSEHRVIPAFGHARRIKARPRFIHLQPGAQCFYCDVILTHENATRDHFIPMSKGGSKGPSNIVMACWQCNHKKGDRMPTEAEILKREFLLRKYAPVVKPKRLKCGPQKHRGASKRKKRSAGTRRTLSRKRKKKNVITEIRIPNKPMAMLKIA